MAIVVLDLKKYLKNNIFPSKTVLVFPPFNGFRRFLIHKLVEDSFASSQVAAFSIGQESNRRIVVCYKGLIRTDQNKSSPITAPKKIRPNMIETEGSNQKSSPKVGVYRPPAIRIAEARNKASEAKNESSKRIRVRRPDQQMYVPRPKRTSCENEQPRSRSSSRTSDSCDKNKSLRQSVGAPVMVESNETRNLLPDKQNVKNVVTKMSSHSSDKTDEIPPKLKTNSRLILSKNNNCTTDNNAEDRLHGTFMNTDLIYTCPEPPVKSDADVPRHCLPDPNRQNNVEITGPQLRPSEYASVTETSSLNKTLTDSPTENTTELEDSKSNCEADCNPILREQEIACDRVNEIVLENNNTATMINSDSSDSCGSPEKNKIDDPKLNNDKLEAMETISLSSESSSPTTATSSDSKDSSYATEPQQDQNACKRGEKMDIEISCGSRHKNVPDKTVGPIKERSNKKRNLSSSPESDDVSIVPDSSSSSNDSLISDSSSSNDSFKSSKEKSTDEEVEITKTSSVVKEKKEKPRKKNNNINPDGLDWESLYDDSGECLVPDLMEELTQSVGKVHVTNADSDYRPYQSIEERTNDGECVIEIYDFPAEFKTTDLMNIFAAYRNKNFQLKWVDDTHALGVFPSPLMADEVLACTLPFVKTRPLRLGITESRNKARNLILPPLPSMERPKTCTALARRLVTGALGLRLPTSSQDREKEKQVLKEAREKRRLEAKQREAAWDGTLTSTNCV